MRKALWSVQHYLDVSGEASGKVVILGGPLREEKDDEQQKRDLVNTPSCILDNRLRTKPHLVWRMEA